MPPQNTPFRASKAAGEGHFEPIGGWHSAANSSHAKNAFTAFPIAHAQTVGPVDVTRRTVQIVDAFVVVVGYQPDDISRSPLIVVTAKDGHQDIRDPIKILV